MRQVRAQTVFHRVAYGIFFSFFLSGLINNPGREDLKLKISEMEAEKKTKEATVNLPALAAYRKREEEYHVRAQELEEANVARKEARA